jgi:hypothetical protein
MATVSPYRFSRWIPCDGLTPQEALDMMEAMGEEKFFFCEVDIAPLASNFSLW